jgi:trans-aconitate 2-methyltransferase
MVDWNTSLYLRFEQERSQPSRDLLARITINQPEEIVDLGCGPGNSTAILRERWPSAKIVGLDKFPGHAGKGKKNGSENRVALPGHQLVAIIEPGRLNFRERFSALAARS